jgi:hypothetical protein
MRSKLSEEQEALLEQESNGQIDFLDTHNLVSPVVLARSMFPQNIAFEDMDAGN